MSNVVTLIQLDNNHLDIIFNFLIRVNKMSVESAEEFMLMQDEMTLIRLYRSIVK